jgi:hypothetical protein
MARKVIGRDELLAMINSHMASLQPCRNLRIMGIALDPQRRHGGNWTTTGLQRSGPDHDQVECEAAIAKFMAELQNTYDLIEQ